MILRFTKDNRSVKAMFQMVDLPPKVLQFPLLGHNMCIALGLISGNMCNEKESNKIWNPDGENVVSKFEDMFSSDKHFEGVFENELNDSSHKQRDVRIRLNKTKFIISSLLVRRSEKDSTNDTQSAEERSECEVRERESSNR